MQPAQNFRQSIDVSVQNSAIYHEISQLIPTELYKAGKLCFHQIFYQKNNQLVVKYLGGWQKQYSIKKFNLNRQTNEKGIRQFKSLYSSDDMQIKKKKKRLHSIDSTYLGQYHLNNWISNEDLLCQKAPNQQKSAVLIYQILSMQWQKALETVKSISKTTEIVALQYILQGFKTIYHLLNEEDKLLGDYFLGRTKYEINVKQQSADSIGGYFNFVNILEFEQKSKFHEIRNIARKAQITKINLEYLVRFAGNFKATISDDYIKLAFKILGNECDQQEQNIQEEKDFLKTLINLNIKLTDRINFAVKLLNEKKRKKLCQALEERLCQFASLDNILFYADPINKQRQKKIQQICRLYLDEYGDLQTIAYLSYEFAFLKHYLKQFKQALQISYEQRQLQRLQTYRYTYEKDVLKEQDYKKYFYNPGCFFDNINTAQQKIIDWKNAKENGVICQICCKMIVKAQNLLICGKCKHGGHINHILKWFNEHQNCPHIGCPCVCN